MKLFKLLQSFCKRFFCKRDFLDILQPDEFEHFKELRSKCTVYTESFIPDNESLAKKELREFFESLVSKYRYQISRKSWKDIKCFRFYRGYRYVFYTPKEYENFRNEFEENFNKSLEKHAEEEKLMSFDSFFSRHWAMVKSSLPEEEVREILKEFDERGWDLGFDEGVSNNHSYNYFDIENMAFEKLYAELYPFFESELDSDTLKPIVLKFFSNGLVRGHNEGVLER